MSDDIYILASGERNHCFTNWATTYSCTPEIFFKPKTIKELKHILSQATLRCKTVRVVGQGHSPSDIACTPDYLVSLEHFNRILNVDSSAFKVTAQGGIIVSDLIKELHANGLALSILGSVSDISLAGAISTGTHGTGANYGILSTYVTELCLLTAAGEELTLRRGEGGDRFLAACCGLGALGIIISVTLNCEASYNLHQVAYGVKLQELLETLPVHVKASQHFRFMWFPHTDSCISYNMNRTSKPVKRNNSWFWGYFIGFVVLQFLYFISTFLPFLTRPISRLYYRLNSGREEFVDRSEKVFNFDCLFSQYVTEWAIPRDKTALVMFELKNWIENSRFPAHFPVEVRFAKGDDLLLSPAFGQETCYINLVMYRPYNKNVAHSAYWKAFIDIVKSAGGRPHWAKDHGLGADELSHMYPRWKDFLRVREELDPCGVFLNKNLKLVFGIKDRQS